MARDGSRKKGGLKKKQSPPSSKAQSRIGQAIKGKRNQKIVKNGRADCAGQPWQTHKQRADFGHTWKRGTRKAQTSPTYTQPIQDIVRSWVRGKRTWFGGGERGKPILRFLLGFFWGKCPAGMIYHPKGQSWARTTKCMPWGIGREKTPTP